MKMIMVESSFKENVLIRLAKKELIGTEINYRIVIHRQACRVSKKPSTCPDIQTVLCNGR